MNNPTHIRIKLAITTCLVVLGLTVLATPGWAATAQVIGASEAGDTGFNDDTPVDPVGGNTGTTLGEQRLNAVRYAADIVASKFISDSALVIRARPDPTFECNRQGGQLAAANPALGLLDFDGAPLAGTAYPIALASAISGRDLIPADNADGDPAEDIQFAYNSAVDDGCLAGHTFYYGLDADTPEGRINFVNTAVHELVHGLGFGSAIDVNTGLYDSGVPTVFDRHIHDLDRQPSWPELTVAQRYTSARNSGRVVFQGQRTDSQGVPALSTGTAGGHVRLFAPAVAQPGSSASHWSTDLDPAQLMEPYESVDLDVRRGIGLASCVLADIGYTLSAEVGCPDGQTFMPGIAVMPAAFDFDPITVGDSATASVTLVNRDAVPHTIGSVNLAGDRVFSIDAGDCTQAPLANGQRCTLSLTLQSRNAGQFTGTAIVAYADQTLSIEGVASVVEAPRPELAPANSDGDTSAPESPTESDPRTDTTNDNTADESTTETTTDSDPETPAAGAPDDGAGPASDSDGTAADQTPAEAADEPETVAAPDSIDTTGGTPGSEPGATTPGEDDESGSDPQPTTEPPETNAPQVSSTDGVDRDSVGNTSQADDASSSGGGCAMTAVDRPFDPLWLLLLCGAAALAYTRRRQPSG